METYGKVSGRQRQLLKTGITDLHFEKTLISSPFFDNFAYSQQAHGHTDLKPVDWQVHLGNFCNSACVFCSPDASSRLAQEQLKLKLITQLPPRSWCDDPIQIDRFISTIESTTNLAYMHFIGGETLITPAFKVILQRLIAAGVGSRISIGFTTNLTVWQPDVLELLDQFKEVNLGMSIECMDSVNDYVRWPSVINSVTDTLHQWIDHGRSRNWIMTLRVTPTCLSVGRLLSVYQFAYQNKLGVESCNFLEDPAHMRIGVLPKHYRQAVAHEFNQWIQSCEQESTATVINTRDPSVVKSYLLQDAASYISYLTAAQDETERLPELIRYLKQIESTRSNCVLDYLPEYEELFRSAGY
jgi:sulfatase maturation enzyme AslB (radical SAM superfamily)